AALGDADVIVRANAIDRYAATKVDPVETRAATLHQLEQRERKAEMNDARLSAITSLAKIDHAERETFLRSLLKDDDPVVRRVAAEQIAEQLKKELPQYTPFPSKRTQAEYEEIVQWSHASHTATIHMTRGIIELALLTQDAPLTTWNFAQLAKRKYFDHSSFMRVVPGYAQRKSDYKPDASVEEMMKTYVTPQDRVEVIMGTWCPDSLREVPKFLRIVDDLKSQFGVALPATFVAVDRAKQKPVKVEK